MKESGSEVIPFPNSKQVFRHEAESPLPEGLFWLMLTDEIPSEADINWLSDDWEKRRQILIRHGEFLIAWIRKLIPMTQLGIGVLSMQHKSEFANRYAEGMNKRDYWDARMKIP
jgi:citrate synthase